jgi:hypothetical protein
MNKELKALERLTKIHNHNEFKECYEIIETTLIDLQTLLGKYEFETIEDLDNFLMSKIPMVYENGKWRRVKDE